MVRGEIYFMDLTPRSGSEQMGRRPGIVAQCLFGKRTLAQRHYRTHHECQALANAFSHHGLVCQGGMQSPEGLLGIAPPSYYPGQKQDHWAGRGKAYDEQDG